MAFCTECGHQLAEGAKFCYECGAKIVEERKANNRERKTVYDGEIHRCPNCGDILDAYESVCETCGYERRGTKATNSIRELARKLEIIEAQRPARRVTSLFAQAFSSNLPKTDEQKINLIQNFPIPNTKEDILEFAVMAISNVDPAAFSSLDRSEYESRIPQALSNAWLSKYEQAYQKGKLMFGNSSELERLHVLYIEKKKAIRKKKNSIWLAFAIFYGVIGLTVGILALAGVLG